MAKARKNSAKTRVESDAFGPLEISADKLWGAQTQRSLHNFRIGNERMPSEIVRALGLKLALQQVGSDRIVVLRVGGMLIAPTLASSQTDAAHQSFHPLAAALQSTALQLSVDAR